MGTRYKLPRDVIHVRFWFLVPEYQVQRVETKALVNLLERFGVESHPSPDQQLAGYILFSTRFRPPSIDTWGIYGMLIFGITAGLEDFPPLQDLIDAAATQRATERRLMARVGNVAQYEAVRLCRHHKLWGYRLAVGVFQRLGKTTLLWTLWHEDTTLVAVILRDPGATTTPYFRWLGRDEWVDKDGIWRAGDLVFEKVTSPGILIMKQERRKDLPGTKF